MQIIFDILVAILLLVLLAKVVSVNEDYAYLKAIFNEYFKHYEEDNEDKANSNSWCVCINSVLPDLLNRVCAICYKQTTHRRIVHTHVGCAQGYIHDNCMEVLLWQKILTMSSKR